MRSALRLTLAMLRIGVSHLMFVVQGIRGLPGEGLALVCRCGGG
jgi:hypothetical protein